VGDPVRGRRLTRWVRRDDVARRDRPPRVPFPTVDRLRAGLERRRERLRQKADAQKERGEKAAGHFLAKPIRVNQFETLPPTLRASCNLSKVPRVVKD